LDQMLRSALVSAQRTCVFQRFSCLILGFTIT
jgi:hypothetical protein